MKSAITKMLNSKDGTVELYAVSGCALMIAHIVYAGYDLIGLGHPFDAVKFGTGAAAIVASLGAAAWGTGKQRQAEQPNGDPNNAEH